MALHVANDARASIRCRRIEAANWVIVRLFLPVAVTFLQARNTEPTTNFRLELDNDLNNAAQPRLRRASQASRDHAEKARGSTN